MTGIFERMTACLMAFARNLIKRVSSIANSESNELDSTPANLGKTWFRR